MKSLAIVLLLLTGCAAVPVPLTEFPGWSFQELGSQRFRVTVGPVKKDAWTEALLFSASLCVMRGHSAFAVTEEDGKGDSGTFFFWNQGYDGRRGMMSFAPGKYFTITCRDKRPTEYETWFDAAKILKKEPNQPPEPTSTAVTPRADARVAPAVPVAHL